MWLSGRSGVTGVTGGVSPHLLFVTPHEKGGGVTGVSPRGYHPTQGWGEWGERGDGTMYVTPSPHPSADFRHFAGKSRVTPPPGVTA